MYTLSLSYINNLLNTNYQTHYEFTTKTNWDYISIAVPLPLEFIHKYRYFLNWDFISAYQPVTEYFVKKHLDFVNFNHLFMAHKFNESFIREFHHMADINLVLKHQALSEALLEELIPEIDLSYASKYQKLSDKFRRKHKIRKPDNNWLYDTTGFKKQMVIKTGLYECHRYHFIAYKGIQPNRHPVYNNIHCYQPGGYYYSNADHTAAQNSFGIHVATKKEAQTYCPDLIIKCRILYHNVARVLKSGVIRTTSINVLN